MRKLIVQILFFFIFFQLIAVELTSEFSISDYYSGQFDSIIEYDNKLFVLELRAIKVYELLDDSLELISEYPLEGYLYKMIHQDEIFYVTTLSLDYSIYRVDFSDIENPVTTNHLTNYPACSSIMLNDNYFFLPEYSHGNTVTHIYNSTTFEEEYQFEISGYRDLIPFTEDIAYNYHNNQITLYDISNPEDINELSVNNVDGFVKENLCAVKDDYLYFKCFFNSPLLIYDISDLNNWEIVDELEMPCSNILIKDDALFGYGSQLIRKYDISDPEDISLLSEGDVFWSGYVDVSYENPYIIALQGNGLIEIYDTSSSEIIKINEYLNYGFLTHSQIHNNNLYLSTYFGGITLYDVQSVRDPALLEIIDPDYIHLKTDSSQNYISSYLWNYENDECLNQVIQITDDDYFEEIYRSNINQDSPFLYVGENNKFFRILDNELQKVVIDNHQLDVEASFDLGDIGAFNLCCLNGSVFVLKNGETLIVENVYEDITNWEMKSYSNNQFSQYDNIYCYDNYLFRSHPSCDSDVVIFFRNHFGNYVELCEIETSGIISIDEENELMFVGSETCTIYDLSTLESGYIPELAEFQGWGLVQDLSVFEVDNQKHLFYLERSSAQIYNYSELVDSEDDELLQITPIITNYPNPITNNSTNRESGTNITMYIENLSKQYVVDIYNAKGQLVRSLEVDTPSHKNVSSAYWDGKDKTNTRVGSGVYFISLSDGKDVIASKKCMVLK